MKKKYIIVGDNNFWYSSTDEITEDELNEELEAVKEGIDNGDYEDFSFGAVSTLFAYEVKEVQRLDL